MSKKCCGIIYKDEKFCTMCGKPLQDVLDMEEVEKIAASVRGDISASEAAKEEEKVKEEVKEEFIEVNAEEISEDTKKEEGASEVVAEAENDKNNDVKLEDEKEVTPEEEPNKEEAQDNKEEEEAEEDDDEEEDDGTASAGLKFFGTLMIILMFAAIAFVGLGVYFVMLNPFYKNHNINEPVIYEQVSTDTDVTNIQTRPGLIPVNIEQATPEDSTTEAVSTATDATESDAEALEDME